MRKSGFFFADFIPAEAKTSGRTSEIIGQWLKQKNNRDKLVIATKIAGPGEYTKHIRTGGFSPKSIEDAINKSLKRLQTDYIDLYQLHWPERKTNFFGTIAAIITIKKSGMIISTKYYSP